MRKYDYKRSWNIIIIKVSNEIKFQTTKISIPPGTCVIIGDSILNGLIEENLSKQHNVRIRKFPGATVDDLNYHVHPILRKKPKHIIIHIGTNDATHSTSREILDKLLKLKTLIKETLPETEVIFSTPTIRSDNGKAALTVTNLWDHLLDLNMDSKLLDSKIESSLVNM